MCKISIVIPVYNSEKYLVRCLDSISRQSFGDFEVILVNDGSTDNSAQICDEYVRKDFRYKVIHCKNNGVSVARNIGIDNASGLYISFIDSDDWVENDYLKSMIDVANSSADIIVSGVICDYRDGSRKMLSMNDCVLSICNSQFFHDLVKSRLLFGPVAKLYKTEILKRNNLKFLTDISYGEDRLFNYDYMRHVTTIAVVNGCNYHYIMQNSNSLTSKSYHNMFDLEYGQWVALLDMYEFHRNLTQEAKHDMYAELFWIINDNLFKAGECVKLDYVKRVLSIPQISDCKKFCRDINYNSVVKWCIFERKYLILYFLLIALKLWKK